MRDAAERLRAAVPVVGKAVARLTELGLSEEEMRRLFEAELAGLSSAAPGAPERGRR